MKLDAGSNQLFNEINMPLSHKDIQWYIQKLKMFNGNVSIQTIFLKGYYNGKYIDNTTSEELNLWLKALTEINPKEVMIYTIDRETPADKLERISTKTLNSICDLVLAHDITAKVYT
jgi:wyosine [tRNA(Phe)-imidazoG37] synthetase (radical SAM superfamily)